jgi:hypothetical protein
MKVGLGIVITLLVLFVGSANAREPEGTSKRVFLDQKGGGIELLATDSKDTEARDAAREEMRRAAGDPNFLESPAIEPHLDKITYRYEQTNRGGRLRISAKTPDALRAVQDFLRSHMINGNPNAVAFRFIKNTSLVSVPVMINNSGPFHFLLDTGASNSILSDRVARLLNIQTIGTGMLHTGGGSVAASLTRLNRLQVGESALKDIEIFSATLPTLQRLEVDGILGADYLRRFKVSIDYEKQVMQIEPLTPIAMALA